MACAWARLNVTLLPLTHPLAPGGRRTAGRVLMSSLHKVNCLGVPLKNRLLVCKTQSQETSVLGAVGCASCHLAVRMEPVCRCDSRPVWSGAGEAPWTPPGAGGGEFQSLTSAHLLGEGRGDPFPLTAGKSRKPLALTRDFPCETPALSLSPEEATAHAPSARHSYS